MNSGHSTQQTIAIEAAYKALVGAADTNDTARDLLYDAIKLEKKARPSKTTAKALIVRAAFGDSLATVADIASLARGLQLAALAGALLRQRHAARFLRFSRLAQDSIAAHDKFLMDQCAEIN